MHQPIRTLILLSFLSYSYAATTVTIDDKNGDPTNGNQISYTPAQIWNQNSQCDGCTAHPDAAQAFDGTWHDSSFLPQAGLKPSASVAFSGTSVAVNCILTGSDPSDMTFSIDGQQAGRFTDPGTSGAYRYGVTVFQQGGLSNGPHTISFEVGDGGSFALVLLDSITYTPGDDASPGSSSSPSSGASPSSSGGTSSAGTSSAGASSASPSSSSQSSSTSSTLFSSSPQGSGSSTAHSSSAGAVASSDTSAPASSPSNTSSSSGGASGAKSNGISGGGIAGIVVGALTLFALVALLMLLRRHRGRGGRSLGDLEPFESRQAMTSSERAVPTPTEKSVMACSRPPHPTEALAHPDSDRLLNTASVSTSATLPATYGRVPSEKPLRDRGAPAHASMLGPMGEDDGAGGDEDSDDDGEPTFGRVILPTYGEAVMSGASPRGRR